MNPSETPTNPAPVPNPTPNLPPEPAAAPNPAPIPTSATPAPTPAPAPALTPETPKPQAQAIPTPPPANAAPTAVETSAPNPAPATGKAKKSPILFIVLAAVLLVLIILGIIFIPKLFKGGSRNKHPSANQEFYYPVSNNTEKYYVDNKGKTAFHDAKFEVAEEFKGGLAVVKAKGEETYQFLHENGELTNTGCKYRSDIQYFPYQERWLACGKLYDTDAKPLSDERYYINDYYYSNAEDPYVGVQTGFGGLYLSFYTDEASRSGTYGYINEDGKVIYEVDAKEAFEYEIMQAPLSRPNSGLQNYCVERYDNNDYDTNYAIVNCDSHKVVYGPQTNNIAPVKNNVFEIQSDNYDDDSHFYYIKDDKVAYDFVGWATYYSGRDIILLNSGYYGDYKYLNMQTLEVSDKEPDFSNSYDYGESFEPWEYLEIYKIKTADGKTTVKKFDGSTILTTEGEAKALPLDTLYLYDTHVFVVTENNTTHIYNSDSGKELQTFSGEPNDYPTDSPFIEICNKEKPDSVLVYNPVIDRYAEFDGTGCDKIRYGGTYFTINNPQGGADYYNFSFNKVYSVNATGK